MIPRIGMNVRTRHQAMVLTGFLFSEIITRIIPRIMMTMTIITTITIIIMMMTMNILIMMKIKKIMIYLI